MLETIEINPSAQPQLSVIWMHGLGADGHDFEGVVPFLGIPPRCKIRFIFPHAPHRSVTINMGMQMRAWYDILNPVLGYAVEDKDGIENSCGLISELICHENSRGVSTDRIVLAGFSQGGAIALYMGLRYPERFAGIMALSTYLPRMDSASEEDCAVNRDTSFLYLHGSMDTMVSISVVERSRQILTELGYNVQAKDYPIAHSVSQEEIADIGNWLIERYDENGG